jgi:hypothetical protein
LPIKLLRLSKDSFENKKEHKMNKNNTAAIVGSLVDILSPLSSEERQRFIQASLVLLGDKPLASDGAQADGNDEEDSYTSTSAKAKQWAKQHGLSSEHLSQVFHKTETGFDIIVAEIPGQTNKEKVRNTYVLTGLARLLETNAPNFDDKSARVECEKLGFYDKTNHSKALKGSNEFTGSTKKGWSLTAPGLKRGAVLVKELSATDD